MNHQENIENFIADRRSAHAVLSAESRVYQKFLPMESAAFKAGALNKREAAETWCAW